MAADRKSPSSKPNFWFVLRPQICKMVILVIFVNVSYATWFRFSRKDSKSTWKVFSQYCNYLGQKSDVDTMLQMVFLQKNVLHTGRFWLVFNMTQIAIALFFIHHNTHKTIDSVSFIIVWDNYKILTNKSII